MVDHRAAFGSAAESFVDQVARIPVDTLSGPGLGEWDLRSLVGHTSRSLTTVESYLSAPASSVVVPTAAHYYLAIADTGAASGPQVVERGRRAGAALGDDPAGSVHDLAARVARTLDTVDAGYLLTTIMGGMRLEDYLRTRTFELVVHGLDLSTATGIDPAFEPAPLTDAATLAAEVAVLGGRGAELLLALTGRTGLAPGFSVV